MSLLKQSKIAIISHVYAPGPPHELESFLATRVKELFFIAHPMAFLKGKASSYRHYRDGKLIADQSGRTWKLPELLIYLKDFLASLWVIGTGPKLDLIIALDNLNATSAIISRLMGKAKLVVYYSIDYIPKRFTSRWLNNFYHQLDLFAVRQANFVWNLSPVMAQMRQKKGLAERFRAKQLTVPIGTHILSIAKVKKDPNLIIFMGHLRPGQGIELLLSAMPAVVKAIPKARLRLIGGGPLETEVNKLVGDLKLSEVVQTTGFISTNEEMRSKLLEGTIAVAPYVDNEESFTRFTDPGKPKEYLAAGLPVIITRVPQFATVIDDRQSGLAIKYDQTELAKAIVKLLTSQDLTKFQQNAKNLAVEYTWDKVFTKAFKEMNFE